MTLLWEKGRQVRSKLGGGHGKEKERERGSALEREWGAGIDRPTGWWGCQSTDAQREGRKCRKEMRESGARESPSGGGPAALSEAQGMVVKREGESAARRGVAPAAQTRGEKP